MGTICRHSSWTTWELFFFKRNWSYWKFHANEHYHLGLRGNGRYNYYSDKPLRKVIVQREGKTSLVLVTNDFNRSSEEIAELYKQRWQIELFFKWIKQNLKIKKFLWKSENAVKTQICIAIIAFILIRLMQKLQEFCKNVFFKL